MKSTPARGVKESLKPFEQSSGENAYAITDDLQAMMQKYVGIVRTESELKAALESIEDLRKRAVKVKVGGNIQFNPGWHLAMDINNMLDISEIVTKAALLRTESRGAHTREDYHDSSDEWGKVNLVTKRIEGEADTRKVALVLPPDELKELLKD